MKKDRHVAYFSYFCLCVSVGIFLIMIFYVIKNAYPALRDVGLGGLFDSSGSWRPISRNPSYSLLPSIFGSLYVSVLAVVFSAFLGVVTAIFLSCYMPKKLADAFLSFLSSLAGVPSVIFGFVGLKIVVKFFKEAGGLSSGHSILAAGSVLAVMLLPFTISTISESVEKVRKKYEKIALGIGISKESFIISVLIPALKRPVMISSLLAFGRGLGETMAVMMLIGNSNIFPSLLGRGQTIPAMTAMELGNVSHGSTHLSAIYFANLVLLLILFLSIRFAGFLKGSERDE